MEANQALKHHITELGLTRTEPAHRLNQAIEELKCLLRRVVSGLTRSSGSTLSLPRSSPATISTAVG
jgi:hypothetical protein